MKSIIQYIEDERPSGCKGALIPEIIISGTKYLIFFGLNPSEAKDDTESDYTEEFYFINPSTMKTKGQQRWTAKLKKMLPDGVGAIQAEMLYWTSKDRQSLEQRIGKLEPGNIYLDASLEINRHLLIEYPNAVVVCLGLSHLDIVKKIFGDGQLVSLLEGDRHTMIKGGYLGGRKVFAVRHPSAYGLTTADVEKVRIFFSQQVNSES